MATVTAVTTDILGYPSTNGLKTQYFPAISVIDVSTFRAGDDTNTPSFRSEPRRIGRLGLFSVEEGGVRRVAILVLPETQTPTRVVVGLGHGLGQNETFYESLGWDDPESRPLIEFILLNHVVNRWGAQVLASSQPRALLHIVRSGARGGELGPFTTAGVLADALRQIRTLTADAFSFNAVEVFCFSSGGSALNGFVRTIAASLTVERVYNIDPNPIRTAYLPPGAVSRQYLTGMTGGGTRASGFEWMPLRRWRNEPEFAARSSDRFAYLHNWCMPGYALHLGMET